MYWKKTILTIPAVAVLLFAVGCNSPFSISSVSEGVIASSNAGEGGDAAPIPTQPLPSVSIDQLSVSDPYPAASDSGMQLPAPIISDESDGAPSRPTPIPTEPIPTVTPTIPTPTMTPIPSITSGPTNTPLPTFTPPPGIENTVPDHFWLQRPIADGGVVWTDKSYPYGGTKGKTLRTHHGVEFFVEPNTPILAAGDGEVVVAGDDFAVSYGAHTNFYGTLVVLKHDMTYQGQSLFTLYGHLNAVNVGVGQQVKAGDQIGLSGATGVADGPHLHFEVRLGQNSYAATRNPLGWLWPFPEYGALVGTVQFPSGVNALEAPVSYRRLDVSNSPVKTVYTYADNRVNGDDVWQENFAADDIPAGYYEVFIKVGSEKVSQEVWIIPWKVTFVEFTIGGP